MMSKVVI